MPTPLHQPDDTAALIVIDVQNGFVPGGNLAVPGGDEVVPVINALAPAFAHIVLTQDWHPAGHLSFASSHPGKKPYDTVMLPYGPQILWPDHCIQGTRDAELCAGLDLPRAQLIVRKGYRRHIDSYSAFEEADHRTPTGLTGYLRERGIRTVYLAGLATDFCVAWSAADACKFGFDTIVIDDATRAIDANGSLARAWQAMAAAGVTRINAEQVAMPAAS